MRCFRNDIFERFDFFEFFWKFWKGLKIWRKKVSSWDEDFGGEEGRMRCFRNVSRIAVTWLIWNWDNKWFPQRNVKIIQKKCKEVFWRNVKRFMKKCWKIHFPWFSSRISENFFFLLNFSYFTQFSCRIIQGDFFYWFHPKKF